jgi:hypothetical protein
MVEEKLGPTVVPVPVCSSDPARAAIRAAVAVRAALEQVAAEAPDGVQAADAIRAVTLELDPGPHAYSDEALADALIARLNAIIANPAVRADVERLLFTRAPCSLATLEHASIQARGSDGQAPGTLAFLGLLNGVVGTRSNGSGHIAAVLTADGHLEQFDRLMDPDPASDMVVEDVDVAVPNAEIA